MQLRSLLAKRQLFKTCSTPCSHKFYVDFVLRYVAKQFWNLSSLTLKDGFFNAWILQEMNYYFFSLYILVSFIFVICECWFVNILVAFEKVSQLSNNTPKYRLRQSFIFIYPDWSNSKNEFIFPIYFSIGNSPMKSDEYCLISSRAIKAEISLLVNSWQGTCISNDLPKQSYSKLC